MSPEAQPERSIISVVGWCSSNKTETTRALTAHLNQLEGDDQRSVFFFSVGGAFRLLSGFPDIPLDTPEAIHASAEAALSIVHTEVNPLTGEIMLMPNGTDAFQQNHHNGLAGSRLGANVHMAAFVHEFVLDLIDRYVPRSKTVIVEGREQYGEGDQDMLLRIHAELPFRAALYPLERQEAKDWDFRKIAQVIAERDAFDTPILAPALEVTRHVIEVERSEIGHEATKRVVERAGAIIYQYQQDSFPEEFEKQPMYVDDR